jgi:hypothetical protein
MRIMFKASTVFLFAGSFSVANALDAPPLADIRCLIVGSIISSSTDATTRTAGNMLAIYSIGRLNLFSAQEIEDAMLSESVTITPAQIKSETARCGADLQEKGRMMQDIGQNIVRRSKEMNKKNPAPTEVPNDSKPTT